MSIHWPSIRGRGRSDAGPLLLVAGVIAVVSALVGVVPSLLRTFADEAVREAVAHAGDNASVLVRTPWTSDYGVTGRIRNPRLADEIDDFGRVAAFRLDSGLSGVLNPPVARVTSDSLKVTDATTPLTFQLTYLSTNGGPGVTWIEGGPPSASVGPADESIEVPYGDPAWPVQVGLSEVEAKTLGLRPGDRIALKDGQQNLKDVRVSGIFRPTDPADPAWRFAPWLLSPDVGADGEGTTRLGGLLSRDSLPDARLAFESTNLERIVWFAPKPAEFTWDSAHVLAGTVVALKATAGSSSGDDTSLKWETQLDVLLRSVQAEVDAASAQASVLLAGVLTVTVLILLLAAELLTRRRAAALGAVRQRGASLPGLFAEQFLESIAVALMAAAAGLIVARFVEPSGAWVWVVPIVVAATVAGPAFGTMAAARATWVRRAPANRAARRWLHQVSRLRGFAMDAAAVIAAVGAFIALYQRGIVHAGAGASVDDDTILPTIAPVLGALAGALTIRRLLPVATRLALRRAVHSRRPLAMFGAARAAAASNRVLAVVTLLASVALASFALTLNTSVREGLADGAWDTVGADARIDVGPAMTASLPALVEGLTTAPDVQSVVEAQITDATPINNGSTIAYPRLVVVDPSALQQLLLLTPLPDAPALSLLTSAEPAAVPALVRSANGDLRPGMRLEMLRNRAPAIPLVAVGVAPTLGDGGDLVIVDAAAMARAGLPVAPNTIWVAGPGAERAAGAVAVDAVLRTSVLRERQTAPLTAGLLLMAWASAATLLALGLLGLILGAATSAPQRWLTLARLRTLGLRRREARWVAAGELLAPVLLTAVGGPLLGVLLARLALGPLALRLLTGQAEEPALVVPWGVLGLLPGALLAAVVVLVRIESRLRRRHSLSDVLRAGEE